MAKVTQAQRDHKSALGDGRFPVANHAQAVSALHLRGHGTTPAERSKIIAAAAKYAPAEAAAARAADKQNGM